MPELVSPTEYARLRNVSQARISQLLKSGQIPKTATRRNGRRYLIDVELADQALSANLDPAQKKKVSIPSAQPAQASPGQAGITYEQARTRREIVRGERERLKLEEEKGRLVSRGDVEAAAFERGRAIRDAMIAIPSRVSAILAGETDEHKIFELLLKEITAALASVSG